jgi:hypothetical protein
MEMQKKEKKEQLRQTHWSEVRELKREPEVVADRAPFPIRRLCKRTATQLPSRTGGADNGVRWPFLQEERRNPGDARISVLPDAFPTSLAEFSIQRFSTFRQAAF